MPKQMLELRDVTLSAATLDPEHLVEKLNLDEARELASAILGQHGVQAFRDVADEVVGEFREEYSGE